MNNMQPPRMQTPQNNNDLKKLYSQFGNLLTPQNRQLLGALITELDKGQGGNRQQLQNIANQLQRNAQAAQNQMQNTPPQHGPMPRPIPNMSNMSNMSNTGQRPQGQQWPGRPASQPKF